MYRAAIEKGTGLFGEMTAVSERVDRVFPTMNELNAAYRIEKGKFFPGSRRQVYTYSMETVGFPG